MNTKLKTFGFLFAFVVITLMLIPTLSTVAQEKKYDFYFISHMGPSDPNSNWFSKGIKEFESHYPEVNAEYIAPPDPTPRKQLERLRTVIAKDPDGLVVSMTAPEMFDSVLRDAINKRDIPVVAFNISDPRPKEDRIPYLTYVGGDLYMDGYKLGQYYLNNFEKPKKVAIAQFNPGHSGLEARASGMTDAMKEADVAVNKLALSPEAGDSKSKLTSYLQRNSDVDVIYSVTTYGEPWVVSVLENLGRMKSTDIIGVDAS